MNASVFWTDQPLVAGTTLRLDGVEGRHAATVMRMRVGEPIELVDGAGARARGTVETSMKDALDVRIDAVQHEPEPLLRCTVVQALLKGEHGELAIDQLTQVGVDVIVPWACQHAVVIADRRDKVLGRARQRLHAAGKQARLARFPRLEDVASTQSIVALVREADLAVLLHESAQTPIQSIVAPAAGHVVLIVGPEGGISAEERDRLLAAGAREARLGPSVLRGSLAGAVAAGVVLAATRWTAGAVDPMAGSSS